jgi:hypothetical protein
MQTPPRRCQEHVADMRPPPQVVALQGSRLVRTAFFDAPFLVATLNVIKNYALAGDAAHGAIFVHYTVSCPPPGAHLLQELARLAAASSLPAGKLRRSSAPACPTLF